MKRASLAVFALVLAGPGGAIRLTQAGEVNNGFNTDTIYVLRSGAWESEVRLLDETAVDPTRSDLGGFGTLADDTWPKAIKTPYKDFAGSQDNSQIKSLCFSNSPVPGTHTPPGARLFGVYDVRSAEGPDGPIDNEPPQYDWTYYSASFQVVELDSTGKRIRVMAVGFAASLFQDLPEPFDICNNHSPDMLIAPWCANNQWGENTRHNINAGCRIGNIRYNPAKNTLLVAANVGEWDIGIQYSPLTGEPAYPRGRVYEFELPDWPEVYYETVEDVPPFCTNPAEMVGEPIPVSDPALVRLVQIYEMPDPHSVSANNGQIRNDNARPAIDVDRNGNVYFTSVFFNATNPPCWTAGKWQGACTPAGGDVVKFSTLGKYGGRDVYVVPITGDDACNLVIQGTNQAGLGHTEYAGGHGIAVRQECNQLVIVPRIECNDPGVDPNFKYVNLFDLTQKEQGGANPCELLRVGVLDEHRCALPRKPYFAQRDDVSGKIFLANLMGACACAQNFMYINNGCPLPVASPNVQPDVGYHLSVINPNGSGPGSLNGSWDAASPPGVPEDVAGACCVTCGNCQSLTRGECDAVGGFYQGTNTTCGDFPCPGEGACCEPCTGECRLTCPDECTGPDRVWMGEGTVCEAGCSVCGPQPMDADCDEDVDQKDFAVFQRCYTGPGGPLPADPMCQCFDRGTDAPAGDGDIDGYDLDVFVNCSSGPDVPASADCAD